MKSFVIVNVSGGSVNRGCNRLFDLSSLLLLYNRSDNRGDNRGDRRRSVPNTKLLKDFIVGHIPCSLYLTSKSE
jgi:hypothetical protein